MIIRLVKKKSGKQTLTCVRSDGSSTGMAEGIFFAEHDLIHYAVETTLGYQNAFYGLLSSGWDIADFGTLDPTTGQKRVIPIEAGHAEMLVGVLQQELAGAIDPSDMDAALRHACETLNVPIPELSAAQYTTIRLRIHDLLAQWHLLPDGEALELVF